MKKQCFKHEEVILYCIWKIITESLASFYANKNKMFLNVPHGGIWMSGGIALLVQHYKEINSFTLRQVYPLEEAMVPCQYENGWDSEPVWTL
jgi:hypothetical protein